GQRGERQYEAERGPLLGPHRSRAPRPGAARVPAGSGALRAVLPGEDAELRRRAPVRVLTSQFGYRLRCPRMAPNPPSSRARMGRSRLGGVPTALAPAQGSSTPRQLALGIAPPVASPAREDLLPGAVKISGWLNHD